MNSKKQSGTSLQYVLESIIPFTDANLNLVFRPSAFFRELDRRGNISKSTAEQTYYRAKRQGLITFDGPVISLSSTAKRLVERTKAPQLPEGTCLMVVFDIPEEYANKRRQLRSLLRELKFSQEQRSVWISSHDHSAIVLSLIHELQIDLYTKVFRSTEII